jgi:very-short-patch-repair endonuclease
MAEHGSRKPDGRVPRVRALRRAMTDAEKKLWWHLRHFQIEGTHFRRQATIGPYFVDFACHEQRLVIEVDGGQHAETSRAALDEKRTSFLEMHGYRVLRFWNNEVISNIEGVMTMIAAALRESATAAPPPLTPPHNAKTRWGRGTERP